MSSESYVGVGALLLAPVILPVALAAAGIGVAGAIAYGGIQVAQASYAEHKRRLTNQYGIKKEQLEALDHAIENISHARQSLAVRIRHQVEREKEAIVGDATFGELTLAAMEELSVDNALTAADNENSCCETAAEKEVDLSDLFAADIALADSDGVTIEEYVGAIRKRVSNLVAFTGPERNAQERILQRCDALALSSMTATDAEAIIGAQVEELCVHLMEGESELRRETYINYVAMCSLMGERPTEMSFEAMAAKSAEMGEAYIQQQVRETVFDTMGESLSEVGLKNEGVVVFDGEEGYLLVDETDSTCGIFLRKSDDNESFLFTTVSAQEPSKVGVDEKRKILLSAQRLCKKKRALFEEVLPDMGITVDLEYEQDPPSIELIHKMPQFSEHVRERHRQTAEKQATTEKERHQE